MSGITAALVQELREKTGAGMMDCKKALTEENGDMEAAIQWLRKKGLSAAAKKAGRVAAEGLVGVLLKDNEGVLLEVNAETDFVARNAQFQTFVTNTLAIALNTAHSLEALQNARYSAERTVQEELTHLIAVIGENMSLRRVKQLGVSKGVIASYIHNKVEGGADNLGRIGVLVALESTASADALRDLGRKIAMHVAAAKPLVLSIEDLPAETVAQERAIFTEQAKASGKPEEVIQKLVDGRLRKFYEESVLLEQVSVLDGQTKIKDMVAQAAKDLGASITLTGFERFALGEGIEKKEDNFAEEVASMTR